MNLAIFDIDGTLTATDHIDDICFVEALADAHSITDVSTDWAGYSHTTDSAITLDIFKHKFNRAPDEAELLKFKSYFVRLLEVYRAEDSSLFAEITGAASTLSRLRREPDWKVAIASGCWRETGELKLKAASVETCEIPAAFAEDGLSREEILQTAVSRAQQAYLQSSFDRVVSIGDGLWDVRTARNLKFAFLGIGRGEREQMLRQAGATHIIKDFADYNQFVSCLKEAEVPSS